LRLILCEVTVEVNDVAILKRFVVN